jgi:hypothetical protein
MIMAVFSGFHFFVPTVTFNRASAFAASRGVQRRSSRFVMTAARLVAGAGEVMLFLWMVIAVACLLPVVVTIWI